MKRFPHSPVAVLLCVFATASTATAIHPAGLFTDNAVLQQNLPLPVWGTAAANEAITVNFDGETASTVSDSDGTWSVKLAPHAAGGPYTLTIQGRPGDVVTLHNVLVGEVWLCGGQSNMKYCLSGWSPDALTPAAIPTSEDPLLHFVIIPNTIALAPATKVNASWQEANPATVGDLTAVGYFFGRELRKQLGVPIGLIDDCTSGTMAQAWTSKEALQAVPMLRHYVTEEDLATADYPAQLDAYHQAVTKFQSDLAAYNASADAAKAAGGPVPANPPKPPVPPVESARWPNGAAHEFNGMIAPIIPYAMRGVIWYQGESNAPQAYEYETLFPTLIADWRSRWQEGDFPFLYVQAAPYMNIRTNPMPNDAGGWQELREAQRHTLSVAPNTGMAVITDLGDSKTAHARRKEPVGERLALLAEALVYGKSVESSGPQFEYATPEGATMRVKFSHATGLKTIDVHDGSDAGPLIASEGTVTGFELAGPNGRYVMANAVIDGETVVVSSPKVTQPVGVRYGWANYPVVNLANSAGLPASPFKSDPWPLASQSKTVTTGP